eukprot:CAMPEP_0174274562 /NCGR_PEP_ID=MMETSP0439-20130205/58352_1 /TAXON_ID=0 /ORGANISM="Stereomyxa ramosa, Strain Chinc5" /LENGTH=318 /DNA_ID=CAMNT_0015366383 /DNA_START=157 /DNA_END=1113 /DNA_ORIENTATION=-
MALGYPLWVVNKHRAMKGRDFQNSVRYIVWEHGDPGSDTAKLEKLYGGVYPASAFYVTSNLFKKFIEKFLFRWLFNVDSKRDRAPLTQSTFDDPARRLNYQYQYYSKNSPYHSRREKLIKIFVGTTAAVIENAITYPLRMAMNIMALNGIVGWDDSVSMVNSYIAANGYKGLYRGILINSLAVSLSAVVGSLEEESMNQCITLANGFMRDMNTIDDTDQQSAVIFHYMYKMGYNLYKVGIVVLLEYFVLLPINRGANRVMLGHSFFDGPLFSLSGGGWTSFLLECLLYQKHWTFDPNFIFSWYVVHQTFGATTESYFR